MSQKIAPGRWDPATRVKAKFLGPFVGFSMIAAGAWLANVLIVKALEAGQPISLVGAALPLAFCGLGAAALFPNVVVPLLYRVIDKVGKDSDAE